MSESVKNHYCCFQVPFYHDPIKCSTTPNASYNKPLIALNYCFALFTCNKVEMVSVKVPGLHKKLAHTLLMYSSINCAHIFRATQILLGVFNFWVLSLIPIFLLFSLIYNIVLTRSYLPTKPQFILTNNLFKYSR